MNQQEYAIYMDSLVRTIDRLSEAIVYAVGNSCEWFVCRLDDYSSVSMKSDNNGTMRLWYRSSAPPTAGFAESIDKYAREEIVRKAEQICGYAMSCLSMSMFPDYNAVSVANEQAEKLKKAAGFVGEA